MAAGGAHNDMSVCAVRGLSGAAPEYRSPSHCCSDKCYFMCAGTRLSANKAGGGRERGGGARGAKTVPGCTPSIGQDRSILVGLSRLTAPVLAMHLACLLAGELFHAVALHLAIMFLTLTLLCY